MNKLHNAYIRYHRALLADDFPRMRKAYGDFQRYRDALFAQDLSSRKKRRSLSEEREIEIQKDTAKETEKLSRNVEKIGKHMRDIIIEYAETISNIRKGLQDVANDIGSDRLRSAVKERFEEDAGGVSKLSEEDLNNVADSYNSMEETLQEVQNIVIGFVKRIDVLWKPIRHLPEFLSRWLDVGNKSTRERAKERELYDKAYGGGRLFDIITKSRSLRGRAVKTSYDKLSQVPAVSRILDDLETREQKERLLRTLAEGMLKGKPKAGVESAIGLLDDWGFEDEAENLSESDLSFEMSNIGTELLDELDLGEEHTAGYYCYHLLRMAQTDEAVSYLEQFEGKVDDHVRTWKEASEIFLGRLKGAAEALDKAYDSKVFEGKFEKQKEFVNSVFLQGQVFDKLVRAGVTRVDALMDYSDRLLTPVIDPEAEESEGQREKEEEREKNEEEERRGEGEAEEETSTDESDKGANIVDIVQQVYPNRVGNRIGVDILKEMGVPLSTLRSLKFANEMIASNPLVKAVGESDEQYAKLVAQAVGRTILNRIESPTGSDLGKFLIEATRKTFEDAIAAKENQIDDVEELQRFLVETTKTYYEKGEEVIDKANIEQTLNHNALQVFEKVSQSTDNPELAQGLSEFISQRMLKTEGPELKKRIIGIYQDSIRNVEEWCRQLISEIIQEGEDYYEREKKSSIIPHRTVLNLRRRRRRRAHVRALLGQHRNGDRYDTANFTRTSLHCFTAVS